MIKLKENEAEIRDYISTMESTQQKINDVVNEFNSLGLSKLKTIDQIRNLLQDMDVCIVDSLPTKEPQKLFGIQISPKKAIELMELDTTKLKSLIAEIEKSRFDMLVEVSKFNGTFVIDPDKLDKSCDQFRLFAVTPKQISVAKTYLQAIDALNNLMAIGVPEALIKKENLSWLSLEHGELTINYSMYHRLIHE